jgi:hypothetical protein
MKHKRRRNPGEDHFTLISPPEKENK